MATIRARKKADGTVSYTVQIRLKKKGVIVYQEAQTFARKQAAQAWAKRRETELAVPGAIERASRKGHTVKEMIERYLIEAEKARPLGETKRLTLNAIKKSYLGEKIDSDISQQVLVDYALWRMGPEGGSVKPQTAGNDLAHLGSVLSLARAAWGYEINPLAMPDARLVLKKFGYNMRSRERDRRPTLDELDKVMEHFFETLQRRPSVIHMPKVVAFAIFSTRRMDEITRILWDDLDEHRKAVKVRDMKNPGQKLGNDVWCHLPDEAWQIVQSMPRECPEIFPYNTDSVGTAWAKACKMKGIEDLHFHDLRHEGVSRLFEMDWDIPRVSSVSGHRDWNSMRRYTHLRGRGDGYKGWKWLDQIIQAPVKLGARVG
ncbi:tyrosine-type recombinase/integrase [Pseudomonas sp. GD03817]|uniref:tyrosine-type recombinase/integrase n=1 Tax=unclassified Pseudomonas TaxID=196821 RepID=UPI00244736E6|nr:MULTISPECIES: tyrosine-type recombinase/integrase [unclassified Pseudomonas]EKT4539568.1 tyrosine-type recombinase/integrase [Pseudomonas putida]MDH1401292.1 tyrosine-type recombinase/integrase [Pseudomonas sp. GD03730]MDH1774956.1 tyrosine-type recombinase/integrase [Pseudomonas sp. GD03817]